MDEPSIPILDYALIAITTLVLTYVTIMDKTPDKGNSEKTLNMLPNLSGSGSALNAGPPKLPAPPSFPNILASGPAPAQQQQNPPQLKIGGKTKRHLRQKNKRTRRV
jgi:hypothetical protein